MGRHYSGGWRLDITWRPDVPRLLSEARIARTAGHALAAARAPAPAGIGIVLTDDAELAELNLEHMGEPGPTDVLSFPLLPPEAFGFTSGGSHRLHPMTDPSRFVPPRSRLGLGDIAISVERAIEQADAGRGGQTGEVRWSAADELRLLVAHGVLHLCGWDHAEPDEQAAMRALEREVLGVPVDAGHLAYEDVRFLEPRG